MCSEHLARNCRYVYFNGPSPHVKCLQTKKSTGNKHAPVDKFHLHYLSAMRNNCPVARLVGHTNDKLIYIYARHVGT